MRTRTSSTSAGSDNCSSGSRRSAIPGEFIRGLKVDLYPEEVYTFTPKGEVKALPRRATPVDFAYSVHTDVGHTCVGARVNGQMVPLRTLLKSGDIVEVVTAEGHKPSRDWLSFVSTARARNKIKHFIHSGEKTRAVELGRRLFDKELRRLDLSAKKVLDVQKLSAIAGDFGSKTADDIFAAVGYGKVSPRSVIAKLVPSREARGAVRRDGHQVGGAPGLSSAGRDDQGSRILTT